MTKPKPCPRAPGPLEEYAARFDDLFTHVAQRRGLREYLAGLLAPRDRNKTLTALAGAEPVVGAQHPAVQRLQFFLSESRWDPERVNARRLELLRADPATAPHEGGVLVIDDSGDRKDGVKTAHVGHQWLGRYGKTDNGVVTVTTVWADERLYYPVHAVPYTPAKHFGKGKNDPAFRTKLAIGADLAVKAAGTGSSKAANRSKTSWAGPTSRSAPAPRSAATRPWSTARSASAGTPGSPIQSRPPHRQHHTPVAERGGPGPATPAPPAPSWPQALPAIRAWLSPWIALQRWWQAWSKAPPPPQLQALMNSLAAGYGLHLYIPN